MHYLIDDTNMNQVRLTENEYIKVQDWISTGKVKDALGDRCEIYELTDCDGDIIVDEDMYDELKILLMKKETRLSFKPNKKGVEKPYSRHPNKEKGTT